MCGIVGWFNHHENILKTKKTFKKMNKTLKYRGKDATGYFFDKHIMLGHQRLAIIDLKKGNQPMHYNGYSIVYNGELYNTQEIKTLLEQDGFSFDTTSDTEVLLKGYIQYKEKILDIIEGIYAFAIYNNGEIFLARDRLGVKPLFYTKTSNHFLFASEIKALLKSNIVKPIINIKSLHELLALGPSKSPGSAVFKDIHELKPAHYLIYKKNKYLTKRYWNVKNKTFNDSFDECKAKIRSLVENAIKRQMVADVDIATLLSGGLDSSIITAICTEELKAKQQQLTSYSIDYKGNNKYFKKNDFQVSLDNDYISKFIARFNNSHKYKVIKRRQLIKYLKASMIARDLPGMADIDSSLLWFSKKISSKYKVILSGECADEIFGGYPWFYNNDLTKINNFPWINHLDIRNDLLNYKIKKKLNLIKYTKKKLEKTMREVPKEKDDKEQVYKNMFYLNMIWFIPTLLERKDRMTMRTSLEARVPFADHKLIEYLWNVPWTYKYYNEQEKGLLRAAFKDLLPKEILERKKNPYPKTHHPQYTKAISKLLSKHLKNKRSILYKIFDIDKIKMLINSTEDYQVPWFGQLMTKPQLLAYLYQFDLWAKHYKIILDI